MSLDKMMGGDMTAANALAARGISTWRDVPPAGAPAAAGAAGGGMGLSIAKAGGQLIDGLLAAQQQKREAGIQERVAEQQQGAERARLRHIVGSGRAQQGASGVSTSSGSALSAYGAAMGNAEANARMAGVDSILRAALAQQQAAAAPWGGVADASKTLLARTLANRRP
jgi:hypothetical protein